MSPLSLEEKPSTPPWTLIITHIFWDTFTSHGDKPSCIEETTYDLYFGDPLYRRLQNLVGNDKLGPERRPVLRQVPFDSLLSQEMWLAGDLSCDSCSRY